MKISRSLFMPSAVKQTGSAASGLGVFQRSLVTSLLLFTLIGAVIKSTAAVSGFSLLLMNFLYS